MLPPFLWKMNDSVLSSYGLNRWIIQDWEMCSDFLATATWGCLLTSGSENIRWEISSFLESSRKIIWKSLSEGYSVETIPHCAPSSAQRLFHCDIVWWWLPYWPKIPSLPWYHWLQSETSPAPPPIAIGCAAIGGSSCREGSGGNGGWFQRENRFRLLVLVV